MTRWPGVSEGSGNKEGFLEKVTFAGRGGRGGAIPFLSEEGLSVQRITGSWRNQAEGGRSARESLSFGNSGK